MTLDGENQLSLRLPPGVRDYLPAAAARRRGIAQALLSEIERWGYQPIITPIYEYDAVLALGAGAPARAMRFVEPTSGDIVALRPDLTPQVARLVATRLRDQPGPLRLAYDGSVVRAPGGAGGQGELYQVGIELVDSSPPGSDLEVIALAEAALARAGIDAVQLDLGHAQVARTALEELGLSREDDAGLHLALAKKDAAQTAELAERAPVSPRRRRLVAALPTLYGGVEVVARARQLVDTRPAARALDELERLIERLSALGLGEQISVDLGEVRGFHYYTGVRFAAFAHGTGEAVCSGGRYDRLLERYGRPAPAAGFAVAVDRVAEVLKSRGVSAPLPSGGLLLAGEFERAFELAARFRGAGFRAVMELEEPLPGEPKLRERARLAGLDRVVVVGTTALRWFAVDGAEQGKLMGAAVKRLMAATSASDLGALLGW